jgi:hypothetical protein
MYIFKLHKHKLRTHGSIPKTLATFEEMYTNKLTGALSKIITDTRMKIKKSVAGGYLRAIRVTARKFSRWARRGDNLHT